MIPSRSFLQASPGRAFQNQVLTRAPVRSTPGQTISRSSISKPRQFGTSLRSNDTPLPRTSARSFFPASRIGAASALCSHSVLLSNRRFNSTAPTPSPAASIPSSTAPTPSPAAPPATSDFSPDALQTFDLDSIVNLPEAPGYLSNLGLDYGWGPTSVCQWVLEHLHFDFGLPWWGAIVGVAVVTRIAMAYPALIAQQTSTKAQEMRKDPVYLKLTQDYQRMAFSGKSEAADLMQVRMQMQYIEKQNGAGPVWHMALPVLQVPFAFGMYKLSRAMGDLPVPGMEEAGILWFTDLSAYDPVYILPCAGMMRMMPWVIGPITILFTMHMPASVQLYFAVAAALQFLQAKIYFIPRVRELAGLPQLVPVDKAAAPPPRYNPFNNRGGATYQAPRTLDTTATENPTGEKKKGAWASMKEQVTSTAEQRQARMDQEEADKLAKAERKQENAMYQARIRDALAKKKGKK